MRFLIRHKLNFGRCPKKNVCQKPPQFNFIPVKETPLYSKSVFWNGIRIPSQNCRSRSNYLILSYSLYFATIREKLLFIISKYADPYYGSEKTWDWHFAGKLAFPATVPIRVHKSHLSDWIWNTENMPLTDFPPTFPGWSACYASFRSRIPIPD